MELSISHLSIAERKSLAMKRSKTEQISNVIESYLHRRNYSEALQPKLSRKSRAQELESMVRAQNLANEASQKNLISYGCLRVDPQSFDEQFQRLKVWCEQQSSHIKEELEKLLFPVFVHLCFGLIIAREVQVEIEFRKKHGQGFLRHSEYQPFIDELSAVRSEAELTLNPYLSPFKSSKYEVSLSHKTFSLLTSFLSRQSNLVLLQVVNDNIHFSLPQNEESIMHVEDQNETTFSSEKDPNLKTSTTVSSLHDQLFLPTLRNYNLKTKPVNACSGDVLPSRFLAAGLANCSIALWNLDHLRPDLVKQPDSVGDPSKLESACRITQFHPVHHRSETEESKRVVSLTGHTSTVYDLKFTKDAEYLISCSGDKTMRLWCLNSFHNVAAYYGHTHSVWCLDLCPATGNFAVTGSADRTARLWTLERTYPLRIFAGHSQDVDCVAFHPNGAYIATGSVDKSVRLWSVADGKLVRLFCGHKGPVLAVAFSPSGQFLASAGEDRRVRVWDLAGGKLAKEFRGHYESIQSLTWLAVSNTLASSASDGTVRIWEMKEDDSTKQSEKDNNVPEYSCLFHTFCTSSLRLKCLDNVLYHIGFCE